MAPEGAIRTLQDMMPPGAARPMPPVELEAVAPALLLPPVQARSTVAAALAGGIFQLGDRVISLRAGGDGPPFGLRGTVSVSHSRSRWFADILRCNIDCERCELVDGEAAERSSRS